ncbi:MAG TPA: hypothetical protein DEF43_09645 [Chloroflexus aurantiacus]|uniref:Uncharacterized protein n=1 Tax=Chloroflexus aurantiacus (strain ATCC 29366 / DSM 635 / J-10-fl) TaxID=324602 RepID=A9WA75_CHLAA|nr:hypothetical protein Caur_1406 [Chloroflexus aurantiacus J-10-fl]RMG52916.1 MAG: hypothetical protein D6716_02205 [Chloroflexota bacterium]HBW67407.1 hypothetical protein [Chloroflexus aurantiacus]
MYAKREFFKFIKVALRRLVYARGDTTLSIEIEREVDRLSVLALVALSEGGGARNDLKSGVTRVTYRHRYAPRSTPVSAHGGCGSVAFRTPNHASPATQPEHHIHTGRSYHGGYSRNAVLCICDRRRHDGVLTSDDFYIR